MTPAPVLADICGGMTMEDRVQHALEVLKRNQLSSDPVPQELYEKAKGIAICWADQGGFIVGGLGGEGIVIVHDTRYLYANAYRPPIAINIAGGSLGVQIGATTTEFIILLNTDDAVTKFTTEGHVNWDATATGTNGPKTDRESETDLDLGHRAIVVYRASGGLYGGTTFGGNSIYAKDSIDEAAYGNGVSIRDIINGRAGYPAYTRKLYRMLHGYIVNLDLP
jgi:lipid-binding SYLF domain-containing protein